MQYLRDVYDFHTKFNIPVPRTPDISDKELVSYRLDFLREELAEIEDAVIEGKVEELLDGLVDLVYVALGTALMLGLDFDVAWQRVQAANMKKIAGLPTGRHKMFDVSKPEGWQRPVLTDLAEPDHERIFP